jgi:arginine exporter protein ArgO
MGQALAQSLPFAIGLIVSPFPLIAIVMILSGPRRVVAPAFALASFLGLVAVGALVLLVSAEYPAEDAGAPATWLSWSRLALGVALLAVAVKKLRARPWRDGPKDPPRWMRTIDSLTWVRAAGLGIAVSVLNPKNLVLALAGAGVIAQADLPTASEIAALVAFVALGTLGVTVPLALSLALGERGLALLKRPKQWMERNHPLIVALLALIFAAVLISNGIEGLNA